MEKSPTLVEAPKQCYLRISVAGQKERTIVFSLFRDTCPLTCLNFASFCNNAPSFKSYQDTEFHRIIPGFMAQGGDYEGKDGKGGKAFHADDGNGAKATLPDESFVHKHDGPGVISMANKGTPGSAGSQFFITFGKAHHLDGKHVVFGAISKDDENTYQEGMKLLSEMEKVDTDENDKPGAMQKILITDCGIGDGRIEINNESEIKTNSSTDKQKRRSKHDYSSEEEKHSARKSRKKSSKSNGDDSDSQYSSSQSSDSTDRHRSRHHKKRKDEQKKKKKKSRSRKRSRKSVDSSDSSEGSENESASEDSRKKRRKTKGKKRRKHEKKRRKSKRYDSSDASGSESSEYSRRRSKKRPKKEKKKSSKKDDQSMSDNIASSNTFGKYGIIRELNIHQSEKLQRSFHIWLEDIKGVPQGSNVAKWELSEYMKEYAEDFNTVTLPHIKYYDYEKWEMEEYQRQKNEASTKKGAISDEYRHREETAKKMMMERQKELEKVRSTMSREKIEEMKRQARMKTEMVNAYKTGDEDMRKKLQRRLEPDEK